ncbi:FtsX-like permease family protein [Algoriphagus sp. D3-2-R+10]|uniref:ABC transporter permease n=1 Tax=Algoriphagus aurantiacus TaxID=3103948 RepID=UPI002B370AB4|nr:ABC transporter permease [Algoriphagus sp. D3-2-R+10]MEB2778521.1 FtsX-like permease family protein [Algoriphagus sp. D3-2-R+10]
MKTSPPKRPLQFLRWFCREDYLEEIEGDLVEVFSKEVEASPRKAKWKFSWNIIKYFRPGFIKSMSNSYQQNTMGMYRSYFKIGWRNLLKNRTFSLINISGLTLGITCSVLIALWVHDEYSMDAFHKDLDRIYTITSTEYSGNEITYGGYDTPGLLGEELKRVMPEVEYAVNHVNDYSTFGVDDKKVKLSGISAGADFFKIFSYPLLFGSQEAALRSPESIAISRNMANLFFGSPELAIHQSVRFENYRDLKVTAVFEDLGNNVSEKFEYVMNWDFHIERNEWLKVWHNSGPTTFIKLREHANAEALKPKLQHFIKNYDDEYSDLDRLELSMQPFGEKYLHSNFKEGKVAGGRIEYVRLFSLVAVFILLIACINFMNLSTARSLKRAKEIGVRKVNGALKTSLISQFLLEALLLTSLAVLFAIVAILILLPQFNLLTGKNIQTPFWDGRFWIGMLVLTLVTGVVSGSYPAFLLSSFKPISAIKEEVKNSLSSLFFRKGLVVFQFALSIIFIVGMMVIAEQVNYIQNKNLGYQKNNLIYLPLSGTIASNFNTFKQEAQKVPGILEISQMSSRPLRLENTTGSVEWEGKAPDTKPVFVQVAVGYDFVKTMQSTILAGRDFSENHADSTNYLINEKALKILGYQDPIGMPLTFWDIKGTIVGVVKDFHFNSLHVPIEPLVIRLNKGYSWGVALIRTDPEKTSEVIESLEVLHKSLNPDFPYAYQFADDEYASLYSSEQVVKKLSGYFAFLAIFISCLGLLGLVIFSSEQRAKEVGIRKVLGASVTQITALLSKDFMKLVFAAIIISAPLAYFVMNDWLEGFEYRITIQWWVFIAAAAGAVIIALLTISVQAIKTAVANPVKSLRSE